MKQLTRFFFVAMLLLAAGLGAGDAEAQQLYTSTSGKVVPSTGPNAITGNAALRSHCNNPANPCSLAGVLANNGLANDTLAVLVSAAGSTLNLSSDLEVNDQLSFRFYMNDGAPSASHAGTVKFSGNLTIAATGVIKDYSDKLAIVVTSPRLTITASATAQTTDPGPNLPGKVTIGESGRLVRIDQPSSQTDQCMTFDDLTLAGRTQISPSICNDQATPNAAEIIITNSLTVNAQLQLQGSAVLRMTAAPASKDRDKAFLAVNDSRGIESFGGTLRVEVAGYDEPDFGTPKDSDVRKDKKCFQVRGSGPVELDLEVTTAQYVCVSVPSIGAGGTSTIYAGTVRLSSTMLDGNLVNRGAARTEVLSGLMLTGNLEIDGRWVSATGLTPQGNPIFTGLDDGILSPTEYATLIASGGVLNDALLDAPIVAIDSLDWEKSATPARTNITACTPDRRPGVHLAQGATIDGELTMSNIAEQIVSKYQSALDAIAADPDATPPIVGRAARDEAGQLAVACQSGLFLEGNGMTTLKGMFKAQELGATSATNAPVGTGEEVHTLGGYVHLGGKYHNLVLEGDVDISGTHTMIETGTAAGASSSINACSMSMASSGAAGNKLILGGSAYQNVEFSTDVTTTTPNIDRTLMLDALTIDKSGGGAEFNEGAAGVLVKYLEPLNGTLSTGSAISGGALLGFQDAGAIAFTGGMGMVENQGTGPAYSAGPSSVVYASGSHEIGAERGGAGNVTILSDGVITIKGKGGKITNLNLYTGTLKVMEELEVSGTITMGNTGKFDLTAGSLKHTGKNLTYAGNMARSAGMALTADSAMAEKVTDMRTITVNQACKGSVGLEVDLNAGYTSTSGNLMITKGALDLNGGGLVLQDHIGGNEGDPQNVKIGEHGMICDSMGEAPCSGSSAFEEDLQRGDELFAALEDIREEDSDEHRVALDRAVEGFTSSVDAKTATHGLGITVGYVEKDHKPVTTFEITAKDKMLPLVKTMGGAVNLNSATKGKKFGVAALYLDGGATTKVTVGADVGRLQVTGDLMVSSGTLTIPKHGQVTLSAGHMQTGGTVALGDSTKYSVAGMFSVKHGVFNQAMVESALSLAGDVMLDSTKSVFKGSTTLIGTGDAQMVSSSADLGSLTVNSGGGVMLSGDVVQGASSDLTLQRGHISTGDHEWMIKNPGTEENLATRTAVPTSEATDVATIWLGNRASFVDGAVARKVAHGNSGMGNEKGGYLFPVGMLSETRDRYRPLILNFATDVSPEAVTVTTSMYSGDVTWPSAGITTPSTSGGTYTLDTHASIMWKVEFSAIPALGATLRVAADGLIGVNDSESLRLVQWDCDGTNVRLAGEFVAELGLDASSVAANGRINGVPNTTMFGVDAAECSIIGIAANYAENPIGDAPPAATPMANVQLIHNIAGVGTTVDVYVDDVLVADNFVFQTATSLSTQIAAGQHMVHVVPATAPDNSTPIASIPVVLAANGMYTVVANGDLTNFNFALLANTRSESVSDDKVEFRIVHGAASLGEVDLRSLTETGRWANNLSFNEATGYRTAEAIVHNVELLDGHTQIDVFELDLGDYINQTLVLALSGTGVSSAMGLTLMGVATDGSVFFPQVVTSAETEELPTEFALQGNYPNPFNPSTQIQFDLPSTADVEIQVIDLLGRMVLSLPSTSVEAGANRTVELDGSSLASGTYLYRLIAKMESGVQVETGRMVLIK